MLLVAVLRWKYLSPMSLCLNCPCVSVVWPLNFTPKLLHSLLLSQPLNQLREKKKVPQNLPSTLAIYYLLAASRVLRPFAAQKDMGQNCLFLCHHLIYPLTSPA